MGSHRGCRGGPSAVYSRNANGLQENNVTSVFKCNEVMNVGLGVEFRIQ